MSGGRNLGVGSAKGAIIAFTDDDAILSRNWAEEIVRTFERYSEVIAVTGASLPLWKDESVEWFPKELYWMIGCTWRDFDRTNKKDLRGVRLARYVSGVNMSFRREAFDTQLFSPAYGKAGKKQGPLGDDRAFALGVTRSTGKTIIFNPRVVVWHKVYRYRTQLSFIRNYAIG